MLKTIKYPVEPHNVILMGQPSHYTRSWIVSPLRRGDYSFIVFPKGMLSLGNTIFRFDLFCQAGMNAPERIKFDVPIHLQSIEEWEWIFVRWNTPMEQLSLDKNVPSLSSLLYEYRPTAKGSFHVKQRDFYSTSKLMIWSCNQPFVTNEQGEPVLHELANTIFDWYQTQVEDLNPDRIWGLGDTAYSDGTTSTDFINQYYDKSQNLILPEAKKNLVHAYRRMYKAHWSFAEMQSVMRNYPHICVWDDHEIRDGWGSEANDFLNGNTVIYQQARLSAEEYILNNGPRVRPLDPDDPSRNDGHQAYIDGMMASFVFDGRSSRKYQDPGGKVISVEQLADFKVFCDLLKEDKKVKFLVMGSAVPFINLIDFIENIGSSSPDLVNDITGELRDDIRDSWHSPGNIGQLKDLISVLRRLHRQRPDLEFVNVSGDIHVANLFSFQPLGFTKALYQVTSSALTNRSHPSDFLNSIIQVGIEAFSDALGVVTRVWDTVSDPNILRLEIEGNYLKMTLKVLDLEQEVINSKLIDGPKDLVYKVGMHRFVGEHLIV